MSDHIFLSHIGLCELEDYVFTNILQPVTSDLVGWLIDVMVTDSSAVRYYTGLCRNMGDIDFLLISPNHFQIAQKIIDNYTEKFDGIFNMANKNGFYRVKYLIPSIIRRAAGVHAGTQFFLLDFHVNHLYHNGVPFTAVPKEKFANIIWGEVASISGMNKVLLPIPDPETLFEIKVSKLIGNDDIDVLALILWERCPLDKYITISNRHRQNINKLWNNIESVFSRFEIFYNRTISTDEREFATNRIRMLTK